jgi:hypothetical protein
MIRLNLWRRPPPNSKVSDRISSPFGLTDSIQPGLHIATWVPGSADTRLNYRPAFRGQVLVPWTPYSIIDRRSGDRIGDTMLNYRPELGMVSPNRKNGFRELAVPSCSHLSARVGLTRHYGRPALRGDDRSPPLSTCVYLRPVRSLKWQ